MAARKRTGKKMAEKPAGATRRKQAPAKGRDRSPGEPTTERERRARAIVKGLRSLYPDADCALEHQSALELLVATILSAQSTDANVNRVTPDLFETYPDAKAFADADREDLEEAIRSTGFFRQKSKNIQAACRRIVEEYDGEVPDEMEELVTLPGVARKTANVILGTCFEKNEGIVVDTHVGRLAHRMDLTWSSKDAKDAGKIERDLMQLVPRDDWTFFGHAMIRHGRQVCKARKPACEDCAVSDPCPSAFRV